MIYRITHTYTLAHGFFGVESDLSPSEFEQVLYYVVMTNINSPNLEKVVDDCIPEAFFPDLLNAFYKDTDLKFLPIGSNPNHQTEFIEFDLYDIECSGTHPKLQEINEKYAIPNATLTLFNFYNQEHIHSAKKAYVLNNTQYKTAEELKVQYDREYEIFNKILSGEPIQPEWEITSQYQKDLTGISYLPSSKREFLNF